MNLRDIAQGKPGDLGYDATIYRLQLETKIQTTERYSFLSRQHRDALLAKWNMDYRWKYWSETP